LSRLCRVTVEYCRRVFLIIVRREVNIFEDENILSGGEL